MSKSQKSRALIGLGILWVILVLFQFSDDSEDTGASSSQVSIVASQGEHLSSKSRNHLSLADILAYPRQTVALAKPRNIFAPLNVDKPTASPKKPVVPAAAPSSGVRRPSPATPPVPSGPSSGELAAQRARQRLNQYRFLGYLKKGGESQAFLTNGQAIYIVKQGETVEGQVQINKIDPTTIVLSTKVRETGDLVEATIPLTKKQQG